MLWGMEKLLNLIFLKELNDNGGNVRAEQNS